jgi:hypothetical protein
MAMQAVAYPVVYELDQPERLSRWKWLIKWLLAIPHVIVLWVLSVVMLFALFIAWVVVVITARFPRGLFDFIVGVNRWSMRVNAYVAHLTDVYPPFSMQDMSGYPVRLNAAYPERQSRLSAFFRWLLVIPQWIVLWLLSYVQGLLVLVNIVVVVFTGRPNADVFRIIAGINRWSARVTLYASLATDKYPPFSLE